MADALNHNQLTGSTPLGEVTKRKTSCRIGFLPNYLDGRPDLLRLANSLAEYTENEVPVFQYDSTGPRSSVQDLRLLKGSRTTLRARLARKLFKRFGGLPKSTDNFLISELFKLSRHSLLHRRLEEFWIRLRIINPIQCPLSSYHHLIENLDRSDIDDIDAFLIVSQIHDDAFVARLRKTGKPVFLYVYSWDHPCKEANIPSDLTGYFVWNKGVASDLVNLIGVPSDRIEIVGSTQLGSLAEFKKRPPKAVNRATHKTIYFGSSVGYPELAKVEARFVRLTYDICLEIGKPFKFVFRPYPFLADWSDYDSLRKLPHLELDTWKRPDGENWRTMNSDVTQHRYQMLQEADAFFHLGTTMGLECCFFKTPSVLIDAGRSSNFPRDLEHPLMRSFCDQYHLNHHMKFDKFPNVVRSIAGMRQILIEILNDTGNKDLCEYNHHVIQDFKLQSLEDISSQIAETMTASADSTRRTDRDLANKETMC